MSTDCCSHCTREVGQSAKVQPTFVDGDTFCPPCFVTRRMGDDPKRFNASQACAVNCPICGWMTVSFGAIPGQKLRCGHCLRFVAHKLRPSELPFTRKEAEAIEGLARQAGLEPQQMRQRSRARA